MIWEKEEVKNNKNKGESEEVAGNYTHLESASCVKQFREVGFQPSRLGLIRKGKAPAVTQPKRSQASGMEILRARESCFLVFFNTTDLCCLNVFNY